MGVLVVAFTKGGVVVADAADAMAVSGIVAMAEAEQAAVVGIRVADGAAPTLEFAKNVGDIQQFGLNIANGDFNANVKEAFANVLGAMAGLLLLPRGPAASLAADYAMSEWFKNAYDAASQWSANQDWQIYEFFNPDPISEYGEGELDTITKGVLQDDGTWINYEYSPEGDLVDVWQTELPQIPEDYSNYDGFFSDGGWNDGSYGWEGGGGGGGGGFDPWEDLPMAYIDNSIQANRTPLIPLDWYTPLSEPQLTSSTIKSAASLVQDAAAFDVPAALETSGHWRAANRSFSAMLEY